MEKEQIKFKANTRKEIKIRMEINKIKKIEQSRKSQNQKLFLFEKVNKMDKSLARLRKKRDYSN